MVPCLSSPLICLCFVLLCFYFLSHVLGVTLVNKTIQGSDVQFSHTSCVLCVQHPKSSLLPSPFTPLYPLLPAPPPFPLGITVLLSVSELSLLTPFTFFTQPPIHAPLTAVSLSSVSVSLFLFCLLVYFVHQSPHVSDIMSYGICLSLSDLFNLA